MNKKLIILSCLILALFMIPSVFANQNWWQEGNSDNYMGGGLGMTLWGSSVNNPYPDIEYNKCTIGGSLFNPVIDDIDYDGRREIITSSSTSLKIYSMDCDLKHIISVSAGSEVYTTIPRSLEFYTVLPSYNYTPQILIDDGVNCQTATNFTTGSYATINLTGGEVFTENSTLHIQAFPHSSLYFDKKVYLHNANGSVIYGNFTLQNNTSPKDFNISLEGALGQQNIFVSGLSEYIRVYWDYIGADVNVQLPSTATNIKAMPVLMNSFENGVPEIYILTNETLNVYQYSRLSEDFLMVYDFNYYDTYSVANLDVLTCMSQIGLTGETCLAMKTGSTDVYTFNIPDLTITKNVGELDYAIESRLYYAGNGLSNSRTLPYRFDVNILQRVSRTFLELLGFDLSELDEYDENYMTPVCFSISGGSNNHLYCNILENDGLDIGKHIESDFSVGGGNNLNWVTSGIAKHGSLYRLFVTYETNATNYLVNEIYDLDGNELFQKTISLASLPYDYQSHFFVVDYNKDGMNEACYFLKETGVSGSTYLKCYDSDFVLLVNLNTTATFNTPKQDLVIADYYPENDYLCVGARSGIYCQEGSNFTKKYSTGLGNTFGFGATTYADEFYSPTYIYTTTSSGIVIKNTLANQECGNDICDYYENFFSCPADCNISIADIAPAETGEYPEHYPCETSADCEFGLNCEYGFCARSGASYECDDDSDCISDECLQGVCTQASYWDRVDYSKTSIYGDDSNTNNFIAITIMIVTALGIIVYSRSIMGIVAGLGAFLVFAVFFAIVGWLSPFILMGVILVGLLAIVLFFIAGGTE